jgi:protein-tyrosine-phosphatase
MGEAGINVHVDYRRPDMPSHAHAKRAPMSAQPPKVLFVCTGNTCRSPYAAAVARRHGLNASSAGLDVRERAATADALAAARARGIDLASHAPCQVRTAALATADIVIGLAESHARALGHGARVLGGGIDDPYGLGPDAYARAYEQIERAVVGLAKELRTRR